MMFARDVEIAVREHDYFEAMRVLHAGLQTRSDLDSLNVGSLNLLLRPSIGLAAAITGDEGALRLIDAAARRFVNAHPEHGAVVSKAASNWNSLAMIHWVQDELESRRQVPVPELIETARTRGFRNLPQALKMLVRHKVLHVQNDVASLDLPPEKPVASNVPPFMEYFATLDDLDEVQAAFYENTFKPNFMRGEAIDLEGNLSYGFVLMGELATTHGYDGLTQLRSFFLCAATFYPGTSLATHTSNWAADSYFLSGEYQTGYDLLVRQGALDLETYIGIAEELVDSRVTGQMAWDWTTSARLRPYGVKHKETVLAELERLLDEEHARRGRSVISEIWRSLAVERAPDEPAPEWVVEIIGDRISPEELGQNLNFMKLYGGRERISFRGLVAPRSPTIQWPSADASGLATYSTYGFHLIVREYLHGLFRTAENAVRNNAGLPRIGEGWISEAALFHQLREAFAETRVIHQGRPKWLGQQSLDIFFPEWGIAVEYQGAQHHRSVEFFGGEVAFMAQQERDERKRRLCTENDVTLIEVLPDYEISEVLIRVLAARESHRGCEELPGDDSPARTWK